MNNEVKNILKSKAFSGYQANEEHMYGGPQVQALEREWASHFKVKHAIAVNSATSALWCACAVYLQDFENRPFTNVVVTPWSMSASAVMPLHFGVDVLFADIEKDYFCISADSFSKKLNSHTKGIIVVDLFGMPYDMTNINEIAKKHNLFVIEDASQAIGATFGSAFAGTLGDIGVFSLNQHKQLSTGEGGVLVTNNDEIAFKLRLLLNHGENIKSKHPYLIGMNMRMTELTAIIARVELARIEQRLKPYIDNAIDFDIPVRPNCTSSYYKYATYDTTNLEMDKYTVSNGYVKPLYQLDVFRDRGYRQNLCPTCEAVNTDIKIATLVTKYYK